MRRRSSRLGILWVLVGLAAWGASSSTVVRAAVSDIRDRANMFQSDTVAKSKSILEEAEKTSGIATVIETIPSLRGGSIDSIALEHARESKGHGIFILIAREDRKIEVLVSREFEGALGAKRLAIRDAF